MLPLTPGSEADPLEYGKRQATLPAVPGYADESQTSTSRRPPSDTIQHMTHSERFLKIVDQAKAVIEETSVEDVRRDLDVGADFALVDTREESEWAAGHAQGAVHLGKGIIERDIEGAIPDTAKKIVLYCGGGYRSALAAEALQKMGYANVYSLAGGWRAWKSAEMPIEEPAES